VDTANFAHLATIMPDGSPHSAPVWIGREDDCLLVCTEAGSLKQKHAARAPRFYLPWVDFVDPYSKSKCAGAWSSGALTLSSATLTRCR